MIINTHTLAHWHTLANRCHRSSIHRRGECPNCQRRYRQRTPESRPSPQSHWVSDVTSATKQSWGHSGWPLGKVEQFHFSLAPRRAEFI